MSEHGKQYPSSSFLEKACSRAPDHVKPSALFYYNVLLWFENWDGDHNSPTMFVLSKNLHRRHLTTSQRATIAAECVPLLREEARKRQLSGLKHVGAIVVTVPSQRERSNVVNELHGKARDIAANAVGVGSTIVQKALAVKEASPDQFERIKAGETTGSPLMVMAATATRRGRPAEQTKWIH